MASNMGKIEEFVMQELIQAGRGAHTLDHTTRVYALCMKIGEELNANLRVLGAAALLHDVGRAREEETGISHSILSGEMGRGVLSESGFKDVEIDQVVDVIRTHRFSEGIEPKLKDLMYTKPARVEAEIRHKTLEAYVNQLRSEL
ncbi:MAG: HD domain-containing protein [Candidatus Thorarchaeota archaeon]|jgi:uncharacterized protein